jgi:hypothetical protein
MLVQRSPDRLAKMCLPQFSGTHLLDLVSEFPLGQYALISGIVDARASAMARDSFRE